MPSETPKLDELLKDSPHFTKVSREMFAAARAELAELREALKGANHAAATAAGILDENKRLRDQVKQARNHLLRYGRHDDDSIDGMKNCKSYECGPETCDCGLDAAIQSLKGS